MSTSAATHERQSHTGLQDTGIEQGARSHVAVLRPAANNGEIPQATAELARKVHPRGTDEMRVRDALGPLFSTGAFVELYSPLGQPELSPALLTMVMILQFRHNLSDRDAAQAVCDRISWTYAFGLDLDYTGFDASVLTESRARLVDTGHVDTLPDLMLDRLKAAGLVKAGGRQRTDSTRVWLLPDNMPLCCLV